MSSKYQIFVSSTYNDLKEQRDLVIKAILEMGHIPVGMEMFSAADEEQWGIIKRQIEQSDYYVVIVAQRYGSVTDTGESYTEKEYDYAATLGVPVLGFIIDDSAPWPSKFTDTENSVVSSLNQFKNKVKKKHVSFWKNSDDLYGKCSIALSKAFSAYPREGWVRASEVKADANTVQELARLSAENAALRKKVAESKAAEEEVKKDELKNLAKLLTANERNVYVWPKSAKDWEESESTNLYVIFAHLAPELMVDKSVADISRFVAAQFTKYDYHEVRGEWPSPSNEIKSWLVDYLTLDLVRPSNKKKPVNDTNEYWTLTDKGAELLGWIRRYNLERALEKKAVPSPESASV